MSESMALVGLDVHASQTHAAVLRPATGELSRAKLRMAPLEVLGFLQRLGGPVRAVYEAGPSGFMLARAAQARGLDVRVVAPGLIPRAPGDRVKTHGASFPVWGDGSAYDDCRLIHDPETSSFRPPSHACFGIALNEPLCIRERCAKETGSGS